MEWFRCGMTDPPARSVCSRYCKVLGLFSGEMLLCRATALLTVAACRQPIRLVACARGPDLKMLPPYLMTMVEELAAGEAQLFDVREPQEALNGKLRASLLVPLSELREGIKPKHDPDMLTYVHCAAGVRVHPASAILGEMGYERVVPLQEGFATLANLGFEVE